MSWLLLVSGVFPLGVVRFFLDWLLSSPSLRCLSQLPVSSVYFRVLTVAPVNRHGGGDCGRSGPVVKSRW